MADHLLSLDTKDRLAFKERRLAGEVFFLLSSGSMMPRGGMVFFWRLLTRAQVAVSATFDLVVKVLVRGGGIKMTPSNKKKDERMRRRETKRSIAPESTSKAFPSFFAQVIIQYWGHQVQI